MPKKDTLYCLAAAIVTAVFLYPTLVATDIYGKIPMAPVALLVAFPIVSLIGMLTMYKIGQKLHMIWQLAKFGQVGVLNTAIDFGILNILIETTKSTSGTGILIINIVSFTIALVNSYFWSKYWVFIGKNKSNFVSFATVTFVGLALNTGVVYALTTYMDPVFVQSETLWANVAKIFATCVSLVWNFAGYKIIVFKETPAKTQLPTEAQAG